MSHTVRDIQPGKGHKYKLNCVLLCGTIGSNFATFYVTDFTDNPHAGRAESDRIHDVKIGNHILPETQILKAEIHVKRIQRIFELKLGSALGIHSSYDLTRDNTLENEDTQLMRRELLRQGEIYEYVKDCGMFKYGLLCNLIISNCKLYDDVLECRINDFYVLGSSETAHLLDETSITSAFGRLMLDVMHKYIRYVETDEAEIRERGGYLSDVVPWKLDLRLSKKMKVDSGSLSKLRSQLWNEDSQSSFSSRPGQRSQNLDSGLNDNFGVSSLQGFPVYTKNTTGVSEEEFDQMMQCEDGSDFDQVLSIPELIGKDYDVGTRALVLGKIVDFNNGNGTIVYKDRVLDTLKVKAISLTITGELSQDEVDLEDTRALIIDENNSLTVWIDTISGILTFFEVSELEELYIRQELLVENVYKSLARCYNVVNFHSQTEMRLQRVKSGGRRFWRVRGLKVGAL